MTDDQNGKDVVRLVASIEIQAAALTTKTDTVERLIGAMDHDDPVQLGRVWALANENCTAATALRKMLQKEIEVGGVWVGRWVGGWGGSGGGGSERRRRRRRR